METRIPLSPMFWNSPTTLIRKARSKSNPLSPTEALPSKTKPSSAIEDVQPGSVGGVGGTVRKIYVKSSTYVEKNLFSNLQMACFKV